MLKPIQAVQSPIATIEFLNQQIGVRMIDLNQVEVRKLEKKSRLNIIA